MYDSKQGLLDPSFWRQTSTRLGCLPRL